MQKEWKATSGGIMCLVAGTWGVMAGVLLTFMTSSYPTVWIRFTPVETLIVNRLAPVAAMLGLVAILGGVYALRRRKWGIAMAGAICAAIIPPPFFVGVLAIVFIAVGREEFRGDEKPVDSVPRDTSTDFVLSGIAEPPDPSESIWPTGVADSTDSQG